MVRGKFHKQNDIEVQASFSFKILTNCQTFFFFLLLLMSIVCLPPVKREIIIFAQPLRSGRIWHKVSL